MKGGTDMEKTAQAGFIGCGTMGGALAAVAARALGGERVQLADFDAAKVAALSERTGAVPSDAVRIAQSCRFVVLGVKPQGMAQAAEEIRGALEERIARGERVTVVSMAAGLPAALIAQLLGGVPVIRIMPNTPVSVGEGMILYCTLGGVTEEEEAFFCETFRPAGMMMKLEESKIDAASAVTGCGPAYVCMFAEALTDGAVRCGLTRAQANLFALQTIAGTARLALESGRDPAILRGEVCSPAGSTIDGVAVLEERAFRGAVMDAVCAAYARTLALKDAGKKN